MGITGTVTQVTSNEQLHPVRFYIKERFRSDI